MGATTHCSLEDLANSCAQARYDAFDIALGQHPTDGSGLADEILQPLDILVVCARALQITFLQTRVGEMAG